MEALSQQERDELWSVGWVIGSCVIFPGKRINGKHTINETRGCHNQILDRFDLTLECIRLHYTGQENPLDDTLQTYGDFFKLFETFQGYVDHFLLQDLVTSDYSEVKFYLPFDGFQSSPLPRYVT